MDDHNIPGIYNYCDGWCERCRFTDRCLNFSMREERRQRRRAQGEDPDNWDAVLEDLHETFSEAIEMLHRWAEEEGIDLDAPLPLPPEPDVDDHPLQLLAFDLLNHAGPLLQRLAETLEHEREALEALPGGPPEEAEIALMRLANSFEVIQWYHTLLAPKTHRALHGQASAELEGEDEREYSRDDARGTAKLIHECCGRLLAALPVVCQRVPELEDDARRLMEITYRLREGIVAAVPGCLSYHRAGLDD